MLMGNPGWRTDQDTTSFTLSMAVSPGTSSITLAFGTKYLLTAGGSTYIFTMPDNPNTNYQTECMLELLRLLQILYD